MKDIVVVLGMHRSGTSSITRGLQVLGVDLGDHLMPAAGDNDKGFWEDLDINALNIDLLKHVGHDWHTLTPVQDDELRSHAVDSFRVRGLQLMRAKLRHTDCFGLKDPRVARLLPFWQDVFSSIDARVSYIAVYRNPISVATSLAQRNGFHSEKSYQLWLDHTLNILNYTANRRRVIVDYDRLMDDPAKQLARIAALLRRRFDPKGQAFAEYRNEFLEEGRRHTRFAIADLRLLHTVPADVLRLYQVLLELSKQKPKLDKAKAALADITRHWQDNDSALRYMRLCEDKIAELSANLERREAELSGIQWDRGELQRVRDTLSEREGEIRRLGEMASSAAAELERLRQVLGERDQEMHRRQSVLEARAGDLDRLSHVINSRDRDMSQLNEALGLRDQQIGKLGELISSRDQEISQLNQSVSRRDGDIVSLQGELRRLYDAIGARGQQLEALRVALHSRDQEVERLDRMMERRDSDLAELRSVMDRREQALRELGHSLAEQQTLNQLLSGALQEQKASSEHLNQTAMQATANNAALLRDAALYQQRIRELDDTVESSRRSLPEYEQRQAQLDRAEESQYEQIIARNTVMRRLKTPGRLARRALLALIHPRHAYRLRQDMRIIRRSGQFDVYYYLSKNLDVRLTACDPIRHYCEQGWQASCNPSAQFDTRAYLEKHPEVCAAGLNPFAHHLRTVAGAQPAPRPARVRKGSGLFARLVMALCLFPATFFHYAGWRAWFKGLGRGKAFFGEILRNPGKSYERLSISPKAVAVPVAALMSMALRIHKNQGVWRAFRNMVIILRTEGTPGVSRRLMERAPRAIKSTSAPPPNSRILVMDYRIPMADISAGERATVGILRDLSAIGYDVVFVPNNMLPSPAYEEELRGYGVTVITRVDGYQWAADYISAHGHGFSTFYLIRVDVAEAVLDTIRRAAPTARVLFHAPDVYFLREGREAELKGDPTLRARADAMRDRELAMMRKVDRTVVVSPAEVPTVQAYLPECRMSVLPALYAPVAGAPRRFGSRRDIFFLGGFAHTPNVDAVQWFVRSVWPLIRKRLPGVNFHVVGSEAPQAVQDLAVEPGVVVDGFVKDLDPLLASMHLGVAPLRYGAGIKGKVAVTMGAGIPCVCTPIAAEGMGFERGVHALIEADAEAFADSVVRLYNDGKLWQRMSDAGREFIRQRFSAEANRSALLSVLNDARALPLDLYLRHCQDLSPRALPCPAGDETVDVSVIVPVYNQWGYTRACLNSILEAAGGGALRYEVILADDGSMDDTVDAARYFPGLRIVRTPKNLGFLRNCNNAAKHARGRHILLLNNDTVVLPGWLEASFRLAEGDASAAMVGSKLLYPDGTIQEAGAVLWNDATACNCGRYLPRDTALYQHVREVDYVSGSSFLIRKSFWEDVGGFDERYKNAYCEDSDLAMTARARGLRVLYQPASEVVHFEHKTYTGERQNFLLPVQRENIQRLRDKWQDVFARDHLAPGTPPHLGMANAERTPPPTTRARRHNGSCNILYFSPFPSHPSNHGNQATIQQFGRRFQSMGHKVHFALLKSHLFSDDVVRDMRACWDTLDIIPNSHPLGANGNPIPFDGWYEEGLGEYLRELCLRYDIDVVFCSYVFQSKLLEFVPAHVLRVIDTHDKMSNRYEMLRANGQPLEFFSCTPEEEGAYMRRADVVVARREEEARYFDGLTGQNSAIVVPHFEDPQFVQKSFSRLANVGVVASANRINLAIVRELLETIDRHPRGRNPGFTLHIAGQVRDMVEELPAQDSAVFRRPWVRMHGFVPDIGKFYADMDLVVSPVTMGTGINVKTVQAMAYGMPLLTTVCGIKGIQTDEIQHNHPDLRSLVDGLFSLQAHPTKLNHLAAASRSRYSAFYQAGLESMATIFAHSKLDIGQERTDAGGSHNEMPIDRDDPGLIDAIYKLLARYFNDGDRGPSVCVPACAAVRFDGDGSQNYVADTLSSGKVHDPDFVIFRIFDAPGDVILDIGANWGYSAASIWASGARSKIVSFEPTVSYRAGLQRIKDIRGDSYDYRLLGLANAAGEMKFVVPVVNDVAISALTSASPPTYDEHLRILASNIRNHVLRWMPSVTSVSLRMLEFSAAVERLDTVLAGDSILVGDRRIVAIKIDVEGLEAEVLRGAEQTLIRHMPLVMLEGGNRFEGLPEFMSGLGYFYAERQERMLLPVKGKGTAVNGFFLHRSRIGEYSQAGILDKTLARPHKAL